MTIEIGEQKDWKFGLITRSVYRKSENFYEINDFSDGWQTAFVDHDTFVKLTKGEISLLTLNWN